MWRRGELVAASQEPVCLPRKLTWKATPSKLNIQHDASGKGNGHARNSLCGKPSLLGELARGLKDAEGELVAASQEPVCLPRKLTWKATPSKLNIQSMLTSPPHPENHHAASARHQQIKHLPHRSRTEDAPFSALGI
jgi:hypothetical protein